MSFLKFISRKEPVTLSELATIFAVSYSITCVVLFGITAYYLF